MKSTYFENDDILQIQESLLRVEFRQGEEGIAERNEPYTVWVQGV